MKTLLSCLFGFLVFFSAESFSQKGSFSTQSEINPKGAVSCSRKKSNDYTPQLLSKADIRHSFDVLKYTLNLDIYSCFISPYPKNFKGSCQVDFRVDSALSSIVLNAVNSSLAIDSVRGAGTTFTHTSNLLTINLSRSYVTGENASVIIYYRHLNVTDIGFYVSGGMVFTDAEPEGARCWYPCYDRPSDKALLDLTAKTPGSVKLGSNGRLADSTKNGDTIYYHWVSRDPIATYLVVISAKVNYGLDIVYWKKTSNPNDSVPMRFYYNSGENVTASKAVIGPMTTYYSRLFGEHPFEKNGFAALNNQFTWGGMENQTLTSICPNCWGENLISHEYAHQWFGDMITCATWADIFLNEGFATFCEALWLESSGGYASYKSDINSDASSYLSGNPGWAISNPAWAVTTPNTNTLFNFAITYAKGACVLHMLRYTLGDTLFFRTIKNYATDVNLKYKSATVPDLNLAVNTTAGGDYNWFFNQWIYNPNHPVYANKYYLENLNNGYWVVGFQPNQTQTNTVFFKMPLMIKIGFVGGTDTTVRVMNNSNGEWFRFSFTKQPNTVTFDPDNQIVLKTATISQVQPVPVELTSFTARVNEQFVTLDWKTATELNNKEFVIERKVAGAAFTEVGRVQGRGTVSEMQAYRFIDRVPGGGEYIYRLKQVDYSGVFEYSGEIVANVFAGPAEFKLYNAYPNPFNPSAAIMFELSEDATVNLSVYSSSGELLAELEKGELKTGIHRYVFNGEKLSSGIYFAVLRAGNKVQRLGLNLVK